MKKQSQTNFIIDALMFLNMMALAGSGFVNRFVLLSGRESKMLYGQKVNMSLLGIDRSGWHTIHLYLGYLLLALLVLHIILHFKQIKAMYHQLITTENTRLIVTVLFIILGLILLLFPFIIKPVIFF